MRRALLPILAALVLALAACGGPGAASDDGNGEESAAASAPASEAEASAEESKGGGNGGPGEIDLEQLVEDLTPPNATETSRTTVGGVIFVTFESSEEPDALEGFYENAIAGTGYDILSRTSAGGSYSWIIHEEAGSDFGGVVSVNPSGTGSGSLVGIQVGSAE